MASPSRRCLSGPARASPRSRSDRRVRADTRRRRAAPMITEQAHAVAAGSRRNVRLRRSTAPAVPVTSAQTRSRRQRDHDERSRRGRRAARASSTRGSTNCGRNAGRTAPSSELRTFTTTPRRYVPCQCRLGRAPADPVVAALSSVADPEPDEVRRPDELDDGERLGGRGEQRGQADDGREHVHQPPVADAERRDDAAGRPPRMLCATM